MDMNLSDHGYHEDSEEHYGSPHVHRCVDCGGFIVQQGIDNTTCHWCVDDGRPRCYQCQERVRVTERRICLGLEHEPHTWGSTQ